MQKTIRICLVCLLALVVSFGAGYCVASFNNDGSDSEYESRLANLETINSELRAENGRITDLNRAITDRLADVTDRLDKAKTIIDGMSNDSGNATDAISRIERNLSILEQAVQTIFGSD